MKELRLGLCSYTITETSELAMATGTRTRSGDKPTAERKPEAAAMPWVSRTAGLPLPNRVAALRDALVDSIEHEVEQGNVRVILWLADRLRVLEAGLEPERQPAEELRNFFNDLDIGELREFAGLAARDE
jgi:hypothetical protein